MTNIYVETRFQVKFSSFTYNLGTTSILQKFFESLQSHYNIIIRCIRGDFI